MAPTKLAASRGGINDPTYDPPTTGTPCTTPWVPRSGTYSPVRSPFWRECYRTPQIRGSVPRHLQPSTVSLLAGVQPYSCRSADECPGTCSPVRTPFWREYNRTTQICARCSGTYNPVRFPFFPGAQPYTTDLIGAIRHPQGRHLQCGLHLCGSVTVHDRSDRCHTALLVRSTVRTNKVSWLEVTGKS